MLYSEWLDQVLVGRIQIKSPPTVFSLASLVLAATIAYCSLFNIATIILRPDKYNIIMKNKICNSYFHTIFVELGWGLDEGSTWCLDEVGVDLGWQCCWWLCVVTAFLLVCSTDSWFHSSSGSCLVFVCHLVAPWLLILDSYSVDLRIITRVVLVIFLKGLVEVLLTDPVSMIRWKFQREKWSTR